MIAMTVKKAKENSIFLDREFYQQALIKLRLWGQDQDALSAVYRALRKVEENDGTITEQQAAANTSAAMSTTDSNSNTLSSSSIGSSSDLHQPPPPPPLVRAPTTTGTMAVPNVSLEGVLQESSTCNLSSLLQLLEVCDMATTTSPLLKNLHVKFISQCPKHFELKLCFKLGHPHERK